MPALPGSVVLSLTIEFLLFIFHLSVLVCIVRNRRRGNAVFRTGFFTLYVMQSIADYVDHGFTLVLYRLSALGYVSQEVFNFPQGQLCFFLLTYGCHFQFLSHAGIALNRFLAMRNAWNPQMQRVMITVLLVLAVPPAATRLVGGITLVETAVPGVYAVIRDVHWVTAVIPFTIVSYSVATAIFSMIFEIWSLIMYKRLTTSAKQKYRNDFLLLIYALLQFLIQVMITVYFGLSAYGTVVGDVQLAAVGRSASQYTGIALCFSPPICLFSMSKSLRRAYFEMYWPPISGSQAASSDTGYPKAEIHRNVITLAEIKP